MPPESRAPAGAERPGLVIICGELTPYRVHFHRRVAREIPELRLWTLLARDSAWSAWKLGAVPEINVVPIGEGTLPMTRSLSGRARLQWLLSRRTLRWLDAHRPAAILVNGYDELSRLSAIRWGRRRRTPVLLWGDSNIRADNPTGLRRAVKRVVVPRVLRRCSALLACGSLGRAYFRRYAVPDEKIFYSPVEPDYDELQNLDPALLEEARRAFGLDPGRFRLVVSSRLVAHKRVDLAIDAFAAIAPSRPLWDLVVLGDGPERASLEARVPADLRRRVRFTGFIGRQGLVTAVYRQSHVLVHPATFEPWALVINEAAAADLAIVSSDTVGASAELVQDGVNGRLVPAGDLPALASAVLDVTSPERLPAMRAASGPILARWRREADPVNGLRQALRALGALPPTQT
jgi:glycosyltransferase involved in cell wall biosynthesis